MNTPENLRQWIHDPDSVKEGNYMSTQIKPGMFSDEQLDALVDYLMTLKPAGGCDDFLATGLAATPGASPVASPAATPVND